MIWHVSEPLPRIPAAELLRALQRDEWTIVRQTVHAQLKHPTKLGRVTLPTHVESPSTSRR